MDMLLFYGYEFLSAFIPFLIAFLLIRRLHKKRNHCHSRSHDMLTIIFALYIVGVYYFTGTGTLYHILTYRLEIRPDQLNLIPFSNEIDIAAYLLNVLLFVPFGVFVPLLWGKTDRLIHPLWTGFAFSLLIEMSQLLNNRSTDIDDVILNTLGAVVGFSLYRVWRQVAKPNDPAGCTSAIELPVYILVMFIGRFLLFNEMGLASALYGF